MIKRSKEDVGKLVKKWGAVLNGPTTPLSACKVMLMESQEKVYTMGEVINSISSEAKTRKPKNKNL